MIGDLIRGAFRRRSQHADNSHLTARPRRLLAMLPTWLSTIASIGMAVGPPLVYADQAYSIIKKKWVECRMDAQSRADGVWDAGTP